VKIELLATGDGSHTLFLPEMDETYHSRKGAITESDYVYIQQGLATLQTSTPRILEFGFGTGLNAWLSYKYGVAHSLQIQFTTVELHPLPAEVWQQLNHFGDEDDRTIWYDLMQAPWDQETELNQFCIYKQQQAFLELEENQCKFDLLYYDAFAPSKQPEVWDMAHLKKAYSCLKSGGVLVTYCAQGQFKRNLKSIGFSVEKLPGPPGKAEMTRAIKP